MSKLLKLCCDLIQRPSITPSDAGCQTLLRQHLEPLGFDCETLIFDDVTNLWATHGQGSPLLCFAGHTDVVPTGPVEQWKSDPFKPELTDGMLYGRGAADMKGSLAAMIGAFEKFLSVHKDHPGTLAFLVTSDEEGEAINGTRRVMETLQDRNIGIDHCLVGEPSSKTTVGDVVRVGRRGSLHLELLVKGIQGHVAYPHKARNPIHQAMLALHKLATEVWDEGNEFFPSTSFQVSNMHAGTGANNVIPGELLVVANFRFSTAITEAQIQTRVEKILAAEKLDYAITWTLSGHPFLSQPSRLTAAVQQSILKHTQQITELSTGGGTSDGRFIALGGAEVVELGPVNASIHQINEHVKFKDLQTLETIYADIIEHVLTD